MSSDDSNPLKKLRRPAETRHLRGNPNEEAYEALKDAENIRRDAERREQMRSLSDYTGEDEDTKRTDVHVHVHQHSQPDIEVEASVEVGPVKVNGVPRWLVIVIGAAVAIAVPLVAWLSSHH